MLQEVRRVTAPDAMAAFFGARAGTAPHGDGSPVTTGWRERWGRAMGSRSSVSRGGDGSSSNQLAELNQALKFSSVGPQGDEDMIMETIVRFDGDGFGDTSHSSHSSRVTASSRTHNAHAHDAAPSPVDRSKRTSSPLVASSSPSHRHMHSHGSHGNVVHRGRRTGNTIGMIGEDAGEATATQSIALAHQRAGASDDARVGMSMGTIVGADGNIAAMIGSVTTQHNLPGSSKKKKKKKQPQRPPPPSGPPPDRGDRADWDPDWAREVTRAHGPTMRRRNRARSARPDRSGSSNSLRLGMDIRTGIGTDFDVMGDAHTHRQGLGQEREPMRRRERARSARLVRGSGGGSSGGSGVSRMNMGIGMGVGAGQMSTNMGMNMGMGLDMGFDMNVGARAINSGAGSGASVRGQHGLIDGV
eukprot:g1829.t1